MTTCWGPQTRPFQVHDLRLAVYYGKSLDDDRTVFLCFYFRYASGFWRLALPLHARSSFIRCCHLSYSKCNLALCDLATKPSENKLPGP